MKNLFCRLLALIVVLGCFAILKTETAIGDDSEVTKIIMAINSAQPPASFV